MSRNSNGGLGCAVLVGAALALWVLMWLFKIAMIVLGVALPIVGVLGGLWMIYHVWAGVGEEKDLEQRREQFDDALDELTALALERLRSTTSAWDEIQRNRGVGTRFETAYFRGEVSPEMQHTLDRVNQLLTTADNLRGQLGDPAVRDDRERRIDLLEEADHIWLELDHLR